MNSTKDGLREMFAMMPRTDISVQLKAEMSRRIIAESCRRKHFREVLSEVMLLSGITILLVGGAVWLLLTYSDINLNVINVINLDSNIDLSVKKPDIDWKHYTDYFKILENLSILKNVVFWGAIAGLLVLLDHFMRKLYYRKHIPKI